MLSLLNPWLLGGLAAVGAPILIHFLFRQRPRPLPWAAMRWLEQALRQTRRQLQLTHFLLLLLRCLLIAAIVLAAARPHINAWSNGGDLVILLDATTSMGPTTSQPGAFATALAGLRANNFTQQRVCLLTLGRDLEVVHDGRAGQLPEALERARVIGGVGGLDRAGNAAHHLQAILDHCRAHSTVLLISDFRQDAGNALSTALAGQVARIHHWSVGTPQSATVLREAPQLPDLIADHASSLELALSPPPRRLTLAQGDTAPSPLPVIDAPYQRVRLPPMTAGLQTLHLAWEHAGLRDRSGLVLALRVRAPLPVLLVGTDPLDYMAIALAAARQHLAVRRVHPANLANQALPEAGLIVLHQTPPAPQRLLDWVASGGHLWCGPAAAAQLAEAGFPFPATTSEVRGGPLAGSREDLAPALRRITIERLAGLAQAPQAAQVCLRAGSRPALLYLAHQRGGLLFDLAGLEARSDFWNQVVAGLWARELIRDTIAQQLQVPGLSTGTQSPRALDLTRPGEHRAIASGEAIDCEPGIWHDTLTDRPLNILPAAEECNLQIPSQRPTAASPDLPPARGRDLGSPIAVLALLLLLVEGLVAARAGARYAH